MSGNYDHLFLFLIHLFHYINLVYLYAFVFAFSAMDSGSVRHTDDQCLKPGLKLLHVLSNQL